MYPSLFDYARATSWPQAVQLLQEGGEEAKVLAGGQSLVPMMALRLATPALLIDVNGAGDGEPRRESGRLVVPALTRHATLQRSVVVRDACPILAEAASWIGNIRVRHRGTIGGSVAHADPAGELPCSLVALEGAVRVLGPSGERIIAASNFFQTYFTTALEPGEVVTAVEVPVIASGRGWAFLELIRRVGDFALVEAAALIDLDDAGQCARVRLTVGAVGERPVDLSDEAGAVLQNGSIDEASAAEVGRRASAAVDPPDAVHGSGAYRREMVAVYVRRALLAAAARAGRGGAA